MAEIRVVLHGLLEVRRRSLWRVRDLSRGWFHQVAHRQVHVRVLVMRQELTVEVLLRAALVMGILDYVYTTCSSQLFPTQLA